MHAGVTRRHPVCVKQREKRSQESSRDSSKDKHNSKPMQMRASALKGNVKHNSSGKVPSKRGADYNYPSGNHPKRGKKSNDQSVGEPDVAEPRERQLDLTKNGDKASNKKSKTEKVSSKGITGKKERSGGDDIGDICFHGIDTLLAGAAAHEGDGSVEGGVLSSKEESAGGGPFMSGTAKAAAERMKTVEIGQQLGQECLQTGTQQAAFAEQQAQLIHQLEQHQLQQAQAQMILQQQLQHGLLQGLDLHSMAALPVTQQQYVQALLQERAMLELQLQQQQPVLHSLGLGGAPGADMQMQLMHHNHLHQQQVRLGANNLNHNDVPYNVSAHKPAPPTSLSASQPPQGGWGHFAGIDSVGPAANEVRLPGLGWGFAEQQAMQHQATFGVAGFGQELTCAGLGLPLAGLGAGSLQLSGDSGQALGSGALGGLLNGYSALRPGLPKIITASASTKSIGEGMAAKIGGEPQREEDRVALGDATSADLPSDETHAAGAPEDDGEEAGTSEGGEGDATESETESDRE